MLHSDVRLLELGLFGKLKTRSVLCVYRPDAPPPSKSDVTGSGASDELQNRHQPPHTVGSGSTPQKHTGRSVNLLQMHFNFIVLMNVEVNPLVLISIDLCLTEFK